MNPNMKSRITLTLATIMLAPLVVLLALPAKVLGGLKTLPATSAGSEGERSLARNCLNCRDCLAVDQPRAQKS